MIKFVEISPSYTSNWMEFLCENCGDGGTMNISESIEVDRNGSPASELKYNCRSCGESLNSA